jgi:REP-associated tyrosine transposase
MDKTIREKHHRLPPDAYRGQVIGAFTICTARRSPAFLDTGLVQIAVTALTEAFTQYHGHVGVYLFMPDHLHLMLSGRDADADLLRMVRGFKQKTACRAHQAGRGFAWQKGFYDHLVRANEDYGAQVRYLLRNPVRQGLCGRWEDWPHKGVLGQTWEQLALNVGTL